MDIFLRHKLIETQNGNVLVLYVDRETSEFAEEFLHSLASKSVQVHNNSVNYIKTFIDDNYSDIKIDTVKIMLGSVVIASIGFSALGQGLINANPVASKPESKTQTDIVNIVKPGNESGNVETNIPSNINENKDTKVEQPAKQDNPGSQVGVPVHEAPAPELKNSYIVQAGDTLYGISSKLGISIDKLKEMNNLTSDVIYSGQKLSLIESAQAPSVVDYLMLVNKSHPLSAGYVPSNLVNPNVLSVDKSKTKMTLEAAKALEALFNKAKQDNIKLTAISGYRSYTRQDAIFTSNISKYGSVEAANQFSAKPGQSEHQTGLAMDVSSPAVNNSLTQSFANTREGIWLKENAPQFGFIIRYQQGKENITGYQFEPWHLRYVGKSAALEITQRNITLEEYLGK